MIQVDGSSHRLIGQGFYAMDALGGVVFVWKESSHQECAVRLANGECYLRYQHVTAAEQREIEGADLFGSDAAYRGRERFGWHRQLNDTEWAEFIRRFQPEPALKLPPPPAAPESFRSGSAVLDPSRLQPAREGRESEDYQRRMVGKNGAG